MRSRQILALDQLHHQRADAVGFLEAVDVRDVRMVERGERLRFALEPRQPLGIVRKRRRAATFSATSRLSFVSRARYTSPMPPAPRAERISYGPRRVPTGRAKCLLGCLLGLYGAGTAGDLLLV